MSRIRVHLGLSRRAEAAQLSDFIGLPSGVRCRTITDPDRAFAADHVPNRLAEWVRLFEPVFDAQSGDSPEFNDVVRD